MTNEEKNKRKGIIYLVIGIVTLIALIAGATYAYFQAVTGNGANINISAGAGTTDHLTFTKGSDIGLNVTADNLKQDEPNVENSTTVTATLIANDTTNEATETYNVYLEVIENNLEYSSYEDGGSPLVFTKEYDKTLGNNRDYNGLTYGYDPRPELYLTIEGPEDFNTTIPGLKQSPLKGEEDNSYDITELREGIYALAEDFEISVTEEELDHTKTDNWKITVTFKNLDSDQQLNTDKTFKGRIIIQAEKLANDLSDVCKEGDKLSDCIKLLHDSSTYGASNLIYHDGSNDLTRGETAGSLEAGDNSYRYTGSYEKVNNYICLGTSCTEKSDDLYRIVGTFGEDGIKVVKADYANKELLGSGTTKPSGDTVDPATNGSYSIVYAYSTETGNNEEKDGFTHRYKGLLDHVDRYRWQENGTDKTAADWTKSLLNKIHLNKKYLSTIDPTYQNLIKEHEWIWRNDNATWENIAIAKDAKTVYNNEVGSLTANSKKDSEKIGLLYVSDYLYGASPINWNKQPYTGVYGYNMETGKKDKNGNPAGSFPETQKNTDYRSVTDSNWLYMGLWEWLITINNNRANLVYAFAVYAAGGVYSHSVGADAFVVRPSFYLESNTTKYRSGTGTASDPYILST